MSRGVLMSISKLTFVGWPAIGQGRTPASRRTILIRLEVGKKNARRFRVGMLLAFGLIWTSAVLGDHDDGVTFSPAVHYAVGESPRSVAIADLDGDQVLDLATGNLRDHSVSVLLGTGDGTFDAAVQYAVGDTPGFVAISDLDGDQVLDLAVANAGAGVSVLLGVGDGTFADAVNYGAGRGASSVAIGDLNGDLVLDLAVANEDSDNLSVLLGIGDGTFSPAVNYATEEFTRSIAIADLNGDLIPDLAAANAGVDGGDAVSVLLGTGDGTFAPAVNYPAGEQPYFIAIGDLNGDLAPDLVVVDQWRDNISVVLGIGDGTFIPAVQYAVGERPKSVAIGDLDGDQVLDLAVANWLGHNVSVLLGTGDGTFDAAVQFATGVLAWSVAIGDLDGDQMPDLAVADGGVSVLLNQLTTRNRYLTFNPVQPDPVAFKLDMVSSLYHPTATVSGWIGVPDANGIASLEPTPVTREWTEPVVHVTGCEITPVAEFELRASADDGATFSPPVALQTIPQPGGGKFWGDIVGAFNGFFWEKANGVTNIDDGLAVIHTWKGKAGAPGLSRSDVHPQEPDRVVNFNDVLFVIFAFQGDPYPFGCPDDPCQDNIATPCP